MAQLTVTLSANAGVCLDFGELRIWVDALHDVKVPGFSRVDPVLQGKMLAHPAFQAPDVIAFTHCHPDHYSADLVEKAKAIWPKAAVLIPGENVCAERWELAVKDANITFFLLPHEGARYADTLHYGIFIRTPDSNVLHAGDCATASPALEAALKGERVDVAVMDFPWLSLPKGQTCVQGKVKPGHLIACHLPFEADDCNGYRQAVQKAARAYNGKVHLLMEPLESIVIDAEDCQGTEPTASQCRN